MTILSPICICLPSVINTDHLNTSDLRKMSSRCTNIYNFTNLTSDQRWSKHHKWGHRPPYPYIKPCCPFTYAGRTLDTHSHLSATTISVTFLIFWSLPNPQQRARNDFREYIYIYLFTIHHAFAMYICVGKCVCESVYSQHTQFKIKKPK